MGRRVRCQTIAFAAGLIALPIAPAVAAQGGPSPSVYRCKQANGSIAYQDFPCKGGVSVDIKPDAADPAAIERLRQREAEFQRSFAQRQAEQAAQRQRQTVERPPPIAPQAENDFVPYETPTYVFIGPAVPRAFHHRDKHVTHHKPPKRAPLAPAGTRRPHRLEPA